MNRKLYFYGRPQKRCGKNTVTLAASICAGHSKAPQMAPVDVLVKTGKKKKTIKVVALQPEDVRKMMLKLSVCKNAQNLYPFKKKCQ